MAIYKMGLKASTHAPVLMCKNHISLCKEWIGLVLGKKSDRASGHMGNRTP